MGHQSWAVNIWEREKKGKNIFDVKTKFCWWISVVFSNKNNCSHATSATCGVYLNANIEVNYHNTTIAGPDKDQTTQKPNRFYVSKMWWVQRYGID